MTLNFNVTRRALSLGSQDSVTGWYSKSFTDTTIEVIILPKGATFMALGMGFYAKYNLTGYTQDVVLEGDEIKDAANNYYEVKTIQENYVGDTFLFRELELTKLPMHYDMPASYGTAPTVQDPRQRTKVWLDNYLVAGNLTKNDNTTNASYITCWADPPYPISKVFQTKGVDLVYTVATPNTEALPLSIGYLENMPISIYTIDKTDISGDKLRWKAEEELRRIAQEYPLGSLRNLDRMSDNKKSLGSTTLYSVTYNLKYKRYA